MPRKRFTSEQIISKLREAEVRLGQGGSLPGRKEFGGLKLSQAQRLRWFERENELLKRLVAALALANQQLKDPSWQRCSAIGLPTNIASGPIPVANYRHPLKPLKVAELA